MADFQTRVMTKAWKAGWIQLNVWATAKVNGPSACPPKMHLPSDMPYMVGLLMPSGDAKNAVIFYFARDVARSRAENRNAPTFFFPAITEIENRKSCFTHHLSHQNHIVQYNPRLFTRHLIKSDRNSHL